MKTENQQKSFEGKCRKCGVPLQRGVALVTVLTGEEDDIGGCVTLSPGGFGKMVECLKCPDCGFSTTIPANSA